MRLNYNIKMDLRGERCGNNVDGIALELFSTAIRCKLGVVLSHFITRSWA
jgi:hypothetical protein